MRLLRIMQAADVARSIKPAVCPEVMEQARVIVERVRLGGEDAVRAYASDFDDRSPSAPLVLAPDAMQEAFDSIDEEARQLLRRVSDRIARFAMAQRESIQPMTIDVPGGKAGHTIEPVRSAGCYAPCGRYPLPSSVLMTAVTARVSGCKRVVVASPGANPLMLAAAHVAAADEFLCVGGAHAIAAMAYGFSGFQRCDVIVGPGNAWVTAAKQIVSGVVGIDMLAGPSELLIIADETADPKLIAADLLAQAEHDVDAVPMLLTTSNELVTAVERELADQLESLPTAATARSALANGFVVRCDSLSQAIALTDQIGPEHLEIMTRDASSIPEQVGNAGGVFIGSQTAEVYGDYGIGPNHTLPTGGTSRFSAGLSVASFLRLRTWIEIVSAEENRCFASDAAQMAGLEGLSGHAVSVHARTRV
ncbi:MAG: histidinol dehydrogenase [Phycisphaerales bacterium]|nr:histidinol dehydrogenase [Phycisphaerales bacterium]